MRATVRRYQQGRPQFAGLVGLRHPILVLAQLLVMLGLSIAPRTTAAQANDPLVGEWRGTSTCLVRPSPCNDEVVVYEITTIAARGDSINIKASKIVRGELEYMGDVQCHRDSAPTQLECRMTYGTWRFRLDSAATPAALKGELFLTSGVKYRDIIVRRSQ